MPCGLALLRHDRPVVSRFLLYSVVAVLLLRTVLRLRFRDLGKRVDRLVNAILLALVVVYSGYLLYWLLAGRA